MSQNESHGRLYDVISIHSRGNDKSVRGRKERKKNCNTSVTVDKWFDVG